MEYKFLERYILPDLERDVNMYGRGGWSLLGSFSMHRDAVGVTYLATMFRALP